MDGLVAAIDIGGRKVGSGHPCFVIAEAGVNHNGDLRLAKQLVEVAANAGADAVKFQTFQADRMASTIAPKAEYQLKTTDAAESQLAMLQRLQLSPEAHRELQSYSHKQGVLFISTPFDNQSVDLLDELGVPAFKIGSGDITNQPLLEYVARKGKPIILSTGMCYLSEVEEAVSVIRSAGNDQLILLHCVSNYPANPADVNLRVMDTMAAAFHVPVGYSDHTLGIEVALAAVAMGACTLEKHVTLSRALPGPDHRASSEPDEFAQLVKGIRTVESALGSGYKRPAPGEAEVAAAARRSLVAAKDIPAGCKLTEDMVAVKRPGSGLPPAMRLQIVGRCAKQDIPAGALITLEMLV